MSRWLWALLGGVVLVAIAAVFWTASNQTNVTPPVSPGPTAVAPAPAPTAQPPRRSAPVPTFAPPRRKLPATLRSQAQPRPPPRRPLPRRPPRPLLLPRPLLIRRPMQDSKPPRRPLRAAPSAPRLRPSSPRSLRPAPAPLAEPPLPPPAPGREAQEVAGVFAPKNLAQLVGAWAYSEGDCERLFQRRGGGWAYRQPVDKFAQAAIVELPKKILLPSAICRIDRRV